MHGPRMIIEMIMTMIKMMMMIRRRRTMTMTMTMIMIFLLSAIRAGLHGCIDIGRKNEKDRLLDPAT